MFDVVRWAAAPTRGRALGRAEVGFTRFVAADDQVHGLFFSACDVGPWCSCSWQAIWRCRALKPLFARRYHTVHLARAAIGGWRCRAPAEVEPHGSRRLQFVGTKDATLGLGDVMGVY